MKCGFMKGVFFGAVIGAMAGIAFDPITNREKRTIKRKIERAMDEMTR